MRRGAGKARQACAARATVPAVALLLLPVPAAAGCGDDLPAEARTRVAGDGVTVAFAPLPAPITTGRLFALDLRVCAGDAALAASRLDVDAEMPVHRHGMNYAPTVSTTGQGRFRADGLLLHMPGHWRLHLVVSTDGRRVRLQHDLNLR